METKSTFDPSRDSHSIHTEVSRLDMEWTGRAAVESALSLIAREVADIILKERLPEILAKIDTTAIANLAIAEAADGVRRTIHQKLPDVVRTETRVYERGIFGGLRRVE